MRNRESHFKPSSLVMLVCLLAWQTEASCQTVMDVEIAPSPEKAASGEFILPEPLALPAESPPKANDPASLNYARDSETGRALGIGPDLEMGPPLGMGPAFETGPAEATTVFGALGPPIDRPKILFQPALPTQSSGGFSILRPDVRLASSDEPLLPSGQPMPFDAMDVLDLGEDRVQLPAAETTEHRGAWIPKTLQEGVTKFKHRQRPLNRLEKAVERYLKTQRCRDIGVGAERLPFALFEMDAAKPSNNIRFRLEAGYDWEFPDRAEFFWSRLGGKGPELTSPAESSVDYQDMRVAIEAGGPKFSATTELPLRFINPTELA
ncbi:MAG: hypothetical protein AAFU85_34140, partial [Planctomycetota bacterium]